MTFEQKLKAVVEKARNMDASCLRLHTIRNHIFSPGIGIAWKLFKTPEERASFGESKEYQEVMEIMDRALKDKLR
jgi:hypothetical protein